MNVGIIIYSCTGNTRSVATKLCDTLLAAGHEATIGDVKLAGERKGGSRDFALGALPKLEGFDALVFGGPVEAFSLTPVMAAYLSQIPSLDGRRVACLVTQGFPYRWMGGNRSLRQMRTLCEAKGARVVGGEAVTWMGAGLEARIARAAAELGRLLTSA
jgi:flavodoxin